MRNRSFIYLLFMLSACFSLFACSSSQDKASDHYQNAKQYFDAGEYEKAKIEYRNVIQLEPKNDAAQCELGETYVHLQDPTKAAEAFYKAIQSNPDNLKARLRLGQILLLAKETRQARDAVNEILGKHPQNIEAMHLLASIQIQERNLSLAVDTLEKTVEMDPGNYTTHLFLAHLLFDLNRSDEAESHYLTAIELDKTKREAYMELAALYRKKGENDKIESLISQWAQVPGDQVQKSADLASYFESRGQIKDAEKKLLEASMNHSDNSQALINLGAFYARHNKNDKALDLYNRALALDENNLSVQARIASLSFSQKEFEKSETAVDAILEQDKDHAEANFIKGLLYFHRNEIPSALSCFEKVITLSPGHAGARFYKARCLLDKGKSDLPGQDIFRVAAGFKTTELWERKLAKDELLEALKIDPAFINARLLLIDILLQSKETLPARNHLDIILKRDSQNLQALIFLGKLKLLEDDLDGAEKIYQAVLERRPDFSSGYVSLGLALTGMKKNDQAIAAFDKALAINPEQMDALYYKVSLYMQQKQADIAIESCEIHRAKFSPDSAAIGIIDLIEGRINMSTGKINEAEKYFKSAVAHNANLTAPYEQLGIINEYRKNIPDAIKNYERLKELNPQYLPTYLNLSRIFKAQGDVKQAKDLLNQALSIKDDYAPAANNLAYILTETGSSLYEALRLSKIASDKDPNNPEYLDTLGWIYYLQGNYDLALVTLEESVKLNPKSAPGQYHLGWACYESKQYEKARTHMKSALELDPNFKGADKARNILGR